jgi:hypothetical protein
VICPTGTLRELGVQSAHEAAGASSARLSLRPLFFEGLGFVHNSGALARRGIAIARWHFVANDPFIAAYPSRRGARAAPQDEVVRLGAKPDLMVRRRIAPSRTMRPPITAVENWNFVQAPVAPQVDPPDPTVQG